MSLIKRKASKQKPEYRIIKEECWWSELFDTKSPHYLYYDDLLKRYRTGCHTTACKHKWEFTEAEVKKLRDLHPGFDEEFYPEYIYE